MTGAGSAQHGGASEARRRLAAMLLLVTLRATPAIFALEGIMRNVP
jgi:hypothetical protein